MTTVDSTNTPDISDTTRLADRIVEFVHQRTDAIVQRFMPDMHVPAFMAGYSQRTYDGPDMACVLAHLKNLGVDRVGGWDIVDAITTILGEVDGDDTILFASHRVAESLLPFGPFDDNAVIKRLDDRQRRSVAAACDTSSVYDPQTDSIPGYPGNYWAVLARGEFNRQSLGLLDDDTILAKAVGHCDCTMRRNENGFFDDSVNSFGRFDIYSADMCLFTEPLWGLLDAERVDRSLRAHAKLLETICMDNGATFVWGRSAGALSVCMTMELASLSLSRELTEDPGRVLALAWHAMDELETWFADDLIDAHRNRMTFEYRAGDRLLDMTLDVLTKLCYVAAKLRQSQDVTCRRADQLWPARDEIVWFDEPNAGVWMYRDEEMAFQFPLVHGRDADYMPWFHNPRVFCTPVDSVLVCGVPRIVTGGREYASVGLPTSIVKQAKGIELSYDDFSTPARMVERLGEDHITGGQRHVRFCVRGRCIEAFETWRFDELPQGVGLQIPESDQAMELEIDSACAYTYHVVNVDGMSQWRSFWGPIRRLHEINFTPQHEIGFRYRLHLPV